MITNSKKITLDDLNNHEKEMLLFGNIGIEREALRIAENHLISKKSHPKALGSSLCNTFITTDFSESLLELITPPMPTTHLSSDFLSDIHKFTYKNIGDESLWPLSMPPNFESESDIPIADYGVSNLALFKQVYRNGLANRYGRSMQAISGIHFNYSLDDKIWNLDIFNSDDLSKKEIKNAIYFRAIRNLHRMNWILLYLFGASPILSKSYPVDNTIDFQPYKDAFFLPFATSLRMSDVGYQSSVQNQLAISLNSLSQYTKSLKSATEMNSNKYQNIFRKYNNPYAQINSNILQIEDEYYATSRPKSSEVSDLRVASKLELHGVNYLELRSIDIDPFSKIGIKKETMTFLQAFILFCTFNESEVISEKEMAEIKMNDALVSYRGREPSLNLIRMGKNILLKDWANEIIDKVTPYIDFLEENSNLSTDFKNRVNDSTKLSSAIMLEKIFEKGLTLNEFGAELSSKNNKYYLDIDYKNDSIRELLVKESTVSLERQKELDGGHNDVSFQDFKNNYFEK
jgi:glutamate--cysteine ligase